MALLEEHGIKETAVILLLSERAAQTVDGDRGAFGSKGGLQVVEGGLIHVGVLGAGKGGGRAHLVPVLPSPPKRG